MHVENANKALLLYTVDSNELRRNCTLCSVPCIAGTGDNTVLRQVLAPIIATKTCNGTGWWGGAITDAMVCAGYQHGRKSICGVRITLVVVT